MKFFGKLLSLVRYLFIVFFTMLFIGSLISGYYLALIPLVLGIFLLTKWVEKLIPNKTKKVNFLLFVMRVISVPLTMYAFFSIGDIYRAEEAHAAGFSSIKEYNVHLEEVRKQKRDEEERIKNEKIAAEIQAKREQQIKLEHERQVEAERNRKIEEERINRIIMDEYFPSYKEGEYEMYSHDDIDFEQNAKNAIQNKIDEHLKMHSMYQSGKDASVFSF